MYIYIYIYVNSLLAASDFAGLRSKGRRDPRRFLRLGRLAPCYENLHEVNPLQAFLGLGIGCSDLRASSRVVGCVVSCAPPSLLVTGCLLVCDRNGSLRCSLLPSPRRQRSWHDVLRRREWVT